MKFNDEWEFENQRSRRHINLNRSVDSFYTPIVNNPQLDYEAVELLFSGDLKYEEAIKFLHKHIFYYVDPEAIKYVQRLLETSNVSCMVSGLKNRQQFKEFAEYLFYKARKI